MNVTSATAFAPASAGNVAIGFDILGFAVDALGDKVSITRTPQRGLTISIARIDVGACFDQLFDDERVSAHRRFQQRR